MSNKIHSSWIGVDFDGTLAHYHPEHGIYPLGKPVAAMVLRVQEWLQAGVEVRIFTARASEVELVFPVKNWLKQAGLPELAITHQKDYGLLQLWDDRAIQLETNTAELITPKQYINLSVNGWMGVELDGTLAHYTPGQSLDCIGEPIGKMYARVQQWLAVGMDVRVFTARAADPDQHPVIKTWLAQHKLDAMPITCEKNFSMSQFWDDRAVHVISNSGNSAGRVNPLIPAPKY